MENTQQQGSIIRSKEWDLAWKIINETDTSLFLTGKAGTGKTTFLRYIKEHTKKRCVVLAPTGIAAINARGVTIHSFFQLPFSPFIPGTTTTEGQSHYRFSKEKLKIIRGTDLLIVDEISMVRSDLLDAMDDALKRFRRNDKPFGGVQLLLIGDLQQLAPVVKEAEWNMLGQYYDSPYFFDSIALKKTSYATVEFTKVFRQDDEKFIGLLNKIRENNADEETLQKLNSRYIPNFKPDKEDGYIQLTTHNAYAQSINDKELEAIKAHTFTFAADIKGDFPEYSYPTESKLTLKLGAQIMFVKNDTSADKRYYNGMIGEICAINENGFSVRAKDTGDIIDVNKETWQNCKYKVNETTKEIEEEVEGTFSQFPVKLAWAITIHKSQGLTFQHAIIDVHSSFAHGQAYVALSRCKTLEGMVLSSPITRSAIISDDTINKYTQDIQAKTPDASKIATMRRRYTINLISELFNFTPLAISLANMTRILDEHLYRAYPRLLEGYKAATKKFKSSITDVAMRFHQQYERMASTGNEEISNELQERITKGAEYFLKEIEPIKELFTKNEISTNNKQIKKQLDNARESMFDALRLKVRMLQYASTQSFTIEGYLQAKAETLLGETPNANKTKATSTREQQKAIVPEGNIHPALLNELSDWRSAKMREAGLPAYCILSQKAITGISNIMPTEANDLMLIPGIGKAKADKYGVEILSIVRRFKKEHNY